MYGVSELVVAGIGISVLGFLFGGRLVGRAVTLSLGMTMLFLAWLQFINFSGDWPSNQPYQREYHPSMTEAIRIERILHSTDSMSSEDWNDYYKCKLHNVCLRKFDKQSGLITPTQSPSVSKTDNKCVTINGIPNCSTLR